jgi:polyphosphate kinase
MLYYSFFNRDISWLSFNERVLMEAASPSVPLMERLKFLAIFSSNLDEFFRVRIPALQSLRKLNKKDNQQTEIQARITEIVNRQQEKFGNLLEQQIIPSLKTRGIHIVYNESIPDIVVPKAIAYFFHTIASFIKVTYLDRSKDFFPENNQLYIAVTLQENDQSRIAFVNIPSDETGRFFISTSADVTYVLFIDDIIAYCIEYIFPNSLVSGAYRVKITRDAELELMDEFDGDISEKIEQQIKKRDYGKATRFLYSPDLPHAITRELVNTFNLRDANVIQGGNYHNLKDFITLPLLSPSLHYQPQPALENTYPEGKLLLRHIDERDLIIHTPYFSYETVLRFFNEAALSEEVEEIYTTLYRVASDSKIVNALISAAHNGKKVTVFVELKARFDEANNIKWGKKMKAAGIRVIYSIPGLKVHAKIALLKRRGGNEKLFTGLFATGNLNESTAKFYTDHILLTSDGNLLEELEKLFGFLSRHKKKEIIKTIEFKHLLVSQFNLQQKFIDLIDSEIKNAQSHLPASITIKLNNLEEKTLITKLYEASNAGVRISLLVRSVCCIIPGVRGMSENISVKRIVDRYLEHGRVFIFHNNGDPLIFMGSSDWMNRNIYRRIEVCFPVLDPALKEEIQAIVDIQLRDNIQAVVLNRDLENVYISTENGYVRSQQEIYRYCAQKKTK